MDLLDPQAHWLVPVHGALLAGGAIVLRGRRRALALLCAPVVALLLSTLLFYGYVRLGTAYLPIVWVLQGAAVAAVGGAITEGRHARRGTAAAVIAALLLGVAVEALRARRPRKVLLDGPRDEAGVLMQDDTVEVRLDGR